MPEVCKENLFISESVPSIAREEILYTISGAKVCKQLDKQFIEPFVHVFGNSQNDPLSLVGRHWYK